jgi:Ran GTPase-activating protein (RanGAP) involved in mRNA processing and transport
MSSKILSLQGKGLKLDSRADIEPWIRDVDPTIVEEVHFGGNTIGVDAAKALAEFLEKTTVLQVSIITEQWDYIACQRDCTLSRLQTLQISLQAV